MAKTSLGLKCAFFACDNTRFSKYIDNIRGISYVGAMSEELITTEELRLHLADLAAQVQTAGASYGVHATRGGPRYQLAALALVDREHVRACVRVTPDEFRRGSSEIRALVRINDVPFGIVVRGELTAIFRRHPTYRPALADRYWGEFLARKAEAPNDLAVRVNALEEKVAELTAKFDEHVARITALEAPARRRSPH
jgi:hypothetical protein